MLSLGEVQKRYSAAKAARDAHRPNWVYNVAFYRGDQWVVFDRIAGILRSAVLRYPRMRYQSNLIQPRVWMLYARLARAEPRYRVAVTGTQPEKLAKAKGAHTMLTYFWQSNGYREVFADALLWAALTGTGIVKVLFDPTGGDEVETAEGVYHTGTVLMDSCSPHEVFVDPLARSFEEASWVIHERVFAVDYVKERWGQEVSSEDVTVMGFYGETKPIARVPGATVKVTRVREFWMRPCDSHPEGQYMVYAGNTVLYDGPNPYADAKVPMPFVRLRWLRVPGQFWGESPVTALRPINVMYNLIRSDILENMIKLSNPLLIAPLNAFLTPPEFEPGEVLYYNPMIPGSLTPVQIQPFPPHSVDMLLRLQQEADDVAGVSEVARGRVPRGARSGEMIGYMVEQDDTRMYPVVAEYENAVADALNMVLRLARHFIELPLVLRVLGPEKHYEAEVFRAKDIPPDADVRVEPGSALPHSAALMQQLAFQLWDRGIIRDPALVVRLSKWGAFEEAVGDVELDTAQAQREVERLKAGKSIEVEDWHNHIVHISEHQRWMKTVDYEDASDAVKQAMRAHLDAHMQYVGRQLQQMAGGGESVGRSSRRRPHAA